MLISENLRLALFSLKSNKMRALLTMLGIIIGIASVIAIMTIGTSLSDALEKQMATLGANNVNVNVYQRYEPGEEFVRRDPKDEDLLSKEEIEKICEKYSDKIASVSAELSTFSNVNLTDNGKSAMVNITGVSVGYFLAENIDMLNGHIFSADENARASMVAIVSDKMVESLWGCSNEDAIGREIEVNTGDSFALFSVVGVYKYEQTGVAGLFGGSSTTSVYIPLRAAQRIKHVENFQSLTLLIKPGNDSNVFSDELNEYLIEMYEDNEFFEAEAFSMASFVESSNTMIQGVSIGVSVIAGIALLVGGIGVMNIMLVSVTERTKEIGIRKALGAQNVHIRVQFILESLTICVIGGIIGILIGIVMGYTGVIVMSKLMSDGGGMEMEMVISNMSIVISLSFSMLIGLFFGFYPANKAAKLNPIDALRFE